MVSLINATNLKTLSVGQYSDKFKQITNAYSVLSIESKKRRYDALRQGKPDPEGFQGFDAAKSWAEMASYMRGFDKGNAKK